MLQPLNFAEPDLTEYETEEEANSTSHKHNIWCDCENCWERGDDSYDRARDGDD